MLWILLIRIRTASLSVWDCSHLLLCTLVIPFLFYSRITTCLKHVFFMTLVYSTYQNESPTSGWEVQDTTTEHLIKTLLAMKTNTTKSARTIICYFTTKMNSVNGHVSVITTTRLYFLQFFSVWFLETNGDLEIQSCDLLECTPLYV